MTKRIIIVLNRPNREMPVMSAIAAQISVLDPSATVKIVPFDGNFMRAASEFAPQVLLMFPMGSVGVSRLVYLIKLRFGCRVVCFRSEGILDPDSPQSIANHVGFDSYGSRLIDAELFWGPGPARLVGGELLRQSKISSPDRIQYFGYPRLERYFSGIDHQERTFVPGAAAEMLDRYPRSKVVLIITGFHFADYTKDDLFGAGDLDAENRYEELVRLVEKVKHFRQQWIDAVRSTVALHRDLLFVVKKHPNEREGGYASLGDEPNVLLIAGDIEFRDILDRAGLLVHYGSTAAADAYITNVPTVYAHSEDPAMLDWFPKMSWPSSWTVPITNLESVIQLYVSGAPGIADNSNQIRHVLEWNFNIRSGVEYRPSRDIAAFLLAGARAQRIPAGDRYMWRSLFWYLHVKVRQLWNFCRARLAGPISSA